MSQVIIDVKDLSKQYMDQFAVKDANFQIKEGSIVGLIGPNGAGKTTIMKMLGGLIHPTKGSISIYDSKTEDDFAKARSRMSFMIETPYAKENMTAKENLEKQRLQKGVPNKSRVDEVLEMVGLSDTGKKTVKNFSLGMRQRLGIANALLSKPEILVLDEPINGLDPEGIVEIRELLLKLNEEQHITIVISSHILSELSLLCSDYIFISHGMIKKQLSANELKEQCREFYHIHTNNDTLAVAILQEQLGITKFFVEEDGSILLYEKLEQLETVSKTLFENGVIPVMLCMNEANLEQFYMDMVGDEDND
ncbi:MAG: ABC transporter ATP-binding protein [Lachnospiraceae bacterium]